VNWHKCNDNCNKVSKQTTNDNIANALYTSVVVLRVAHFFRVARDYLGMRRKCAQ